MSLKFVVLYKFKSNIRHLNNFFAIYQHHRSTNTNYLFTVRKHHRNANNSFNGYFFAMVEYNRNLEYTNQTINHSCFSVYWFLIRINKNAGNIDACYFYVKLFVFSWSHSFVFHRLQA